MATTGQELKKSLGLSEIRYVSVARILISSRNVYMVFYDTRRPTMPITTRRAVKGYSPSMMYRYPFDRKPAIAPLVQIEDFNGDLKSALFFVVDLAGSYYDVKHLDFVLEKTEKKLERYTLMQGKLQEFLTLDDLNTTAIASDMTKRFRRQRNSLAGTENKLAKLIDIAIDEGDRSVTFQFLTDVTPYPEDPDHTYGELDPDNFKIKRNPSKTYELQIKVLDFFDWLDTNPEKTEITESDIKEIFDVSNVQVFSTDPGFHWQGGNYWMSQLDASIHPTDIAPQFWNQPTYHGSGPNLTSKHLYGLLRNWKFWRNPAASMLTKKLKQRGLIE